MPYKYVIIISPILPKVICFLLITLISKVRFEEKSIFGKVFTLRFVSMSPQKARKTCFCEIDRACPQELFNKTYTKKWGLKN